MTILVLSNRDGRAELLVVAEEIAAVEQVPDSPTKIHLRSSEVIETTILYEVVKEMWKKSMGIIDYEGEEAYGSTAETSERAVSGKSSEGSS